MLLNTRLANFLSVVLHPLLMPTILFSIIIFLAPMPIGLDYFDLKFRFLLLGFIFLYTFFAPSITIYWLHRAGIVKSMKMEDLKDRRIPYMLTALIYGAFAYFLFMKNTVLYPLAYILGSITLVILLVGIISFWWQISAHAAGIGGTIGAIVALMIRFDEVSLFYPALFLLLIAGFLLSARLYLNAHSLAQVAIGFLLGIIVSVSSIFLFF